MKTEADSNLKPFPFSFPRSDPSAGLSRQAEGESKECKEGEKGGTDNQSKMAEMIWLLGVKASEYKRYKNKV